MLRFLKWLIIALPSLSCVRDVSPSVIGPPGCFHELARGLRKDIPLRAGMTIGEVRTWISANNRRVDRLQAGSTAPSVPPIFADQSKHLYVFLDLTDDSERERKALFFVNGAIQCKLEMLLRDSVVESIYMVPGNLTIVPRQKFLFDSNSGQHWDLVRDNPSP